MVYPVQFLRLVMVGTSYPQEGWSTSLNLASNFEGEISQPADLTPYTDACKAWFMGAAAGISSSAKMTMVKVNLIGVDGRYADAGSSHFQEIDPGVPGAAAAQCVPQLTVALSLRTAKSRGLASRGRLFPPLCNPGVAADGLITTSSAHDRATGMAELINDLNAIPNVGTVSILSDVREGAVQPVTYVEAGRTVDTQRRRRASLPENPVQSSIPITFP